MTRVAAVVGLLLLSLLPATTGSAGMTALGICVLAALWLVGRATAAAPVRVRSHARHPQALGPGQVHRQFAPEVDGRPRPRAPGCGGSVPTR